MHRDFSILLSEYSRLLSTCNANNPGSYVESLEVIPILLKTGTFTPSRLEHWPFPQISHKMSSDPDYQKTIIESFIELTSFPGEPNQFTLNEKKGLAFLMAAREKFPQLLIQFLPAVEALPRLILACLEYKIFVEATENIVVEICRSLPIPLPEASDLLSKLKTHSSLLVAAIVHPTIIDTKHVLEALKTSPNPSTEYHLIAALECAARSLDSKELYAEIVAPIWGTENTSLARTVLTALSQCPQLESFCKEYLKDL